MSTIYEQAPPDVHEMAKEIIAQHHPALQRMLDGEPVRLCILFASSSDEKQPAVKCHGYPAAAVISIIPYKQRVDKRADAEIIIDERHWEGLTDVQRRALLDHEITHLEIDLDENNLVRTDDSGRPKLRLKLHDFDFGGFRSVARRYGADAPEVILARKFEEDFGEDVLRSGDRLFA